MNLKEKCEGYNMTLDKNCERNHDFKKLKKKIGGNFSFIEFDQKADSHWVHVDIFGYLF